MTSARTFTIILTSFIVASIGCDGENATVVHDAGVADASHDAGTLERDAGPSVDDEDGGTSPVDVVPPEVTLTSPRDGAMSASSRVEVTGSVSDEVALDTFTLDGDEGALPISPGEDGRFSVLVPLTPGENALRFVARDVAGNEAVETLNIYFGHRISVGNSQGASIREGQLYTWGRNELGQLGNGTLDGSGWGDDGETSALPVRYAVDLEGVVSIVNRQTFMIALLRDGTVATWGSNSAGQLGYDAEADCGTTGNRPCRRTPTVVPGITGAIAVQAGFNHALILLEDGTVMTWGDNGSGQLGYPTATSSSVSPATVPELTNVIQLAAGSTSSFALDAEGRVWAWGENVHAQLGLGAADGEAHPTPSVIKGLSGVRAIASANTTAYALLGDGTVVAWGRNHAGQAGVGDDSGEDVLTPTPVLVEEVGSADPPLEGVANLAADGFVGMALTRDGRVLTWGLGGLGQLGQGALPGGERDLDNRFSASEVAVDEADRAVFDIVEIEVGAGGPALALARGGHLFGWGWSFRGSLGLEGAIDAWAYTTPVLVFASE